MWVGLILCQRGLVGFGLPFINRFMFGLWVRGLANRSWKGFGFGIWPTEGIGLCLGLMKSMGFRLEAWPIEGSTSVTLDQLIPHLQ